VIWGKGKGGGWSVGRGGGDSWGKESADSALNNLFNFYGEIGPILSESNRV